VTFGNGFIRVDANKDSTHLESNSTFIESKNHLGRESEIVISDRIDQSDVSKMTYSHVFGTVVGATWVTD
jgi:hypothetical protein